MLDPTIIKAAAQRLHEAEKNRKQIRQLSLEYPQITVATPTRSNANG